MSSFTDPRSSTGILSRGKNIYPGGTNNATRSGQGNNMQVAAKQRQLPNQFNPNQRSTFGVQQPVNQTPTTGPYTRGTGSTPQNQFPGSYTRPSTPAPTGPMTNGGGRANPYGDVFRPTQLRPQPGLGGSDGNSTADMWIGEMNPQATTAQNTAIEQATQNTPVPSITIPDTDPLIEAARTNVGAMTESLQNQRGAQEAQIRSQLDAIMARLGLQRNDALESNDARMASQGIFRSGITGEEAGKITEQFNQSGEDVAQETNNLITQLGQDVSSQISQLENNLRTAEAEFATRQEQAAAQGAQQQAEALAARQQMIDQILNNNVISPFNMAIQASPTGQLNYQPATMPQLGNYQVQEPQVDVGSQQFNPALSSSFGTPATLDSALRRRLYGS